MEQQYSKNIIKVDIEDEMKKSFISYAMAVIIDRALPDVRDGLKPVHRRILYAMNELGLTPDKPFRKSARIVGDVLGKYHPHGDTAVYDSMVRMAQDFSTREMLVLGHGNFGSVDGDSPAAMRYTEAKLSKIATELLRDIDKETVDFYPNFDETLMQPSVLPSRFPNLLVNGSSGIAVGMATNIPPHNLGEVIDGVVALIEDPDIEIQDLMQYIQGPDFPTGATIMGYTGIKDAYMTGKGRVIVRGKTEVEQVTSNRAHIIVTEIPYQVNKARLIERIADLVQDKKIEGISDLRDESDRNGMRIVIELKRDVNAGVILNALYKHTQLQDTFGVNMLALVNGEPKVLNLKQVLYYYLEHQKNVVIRRTQYELNKAEKRAHILEGLLVALDNIDEVIRIIRGSKSDSEAKIKLTEAFALTDVQVQAILDMRLRRLTSLESEKILSEYNELEKKIAYLKEVLGSEQLVLGIVKDEILEIKEKYQNDRRTDIEPVMNEIEMEDLIQPEDIVVTKTHFGYIKRMPATTYRVQRRGGKGIIGMATREEDFVEDIMVTNTHDNIMFFTNKGRAFRLKAFMIPQASRTAKGTAIVNILQLQDGETVTACFNVKEKETESKYLVLCTKLGTVKKTPFEEYENIRKGGLIAIGLRDDDELISVAITNGKSELFIGTHDGKCIRMAEEDIRPMGRTAMGVRGIKLNKNDYVVDMEEIKEGTKVLAITENGMGKRTELDNYRLQTRGGKGVKVMNINERTGKLVGFKMVRDDQDIMLISDDGTIIRMAVDEISVLTRDTQGVKLMRVDNEQKVVCVAKAAKEDDDEDLDAGEPAEGTENEETQNVQETEEQNTEE